MQGHSCVTCQTSVWWWRCHYCDLSPARCVLSLKVLASSGRSRLNWSSPGPVQMLRTDIGQEEVDCLWLFGLSQFPRGDFAASSLAESLPQQGGTLDLILMCARELYLKGSKQFIPRILNDLMAILLAHHEQEGISEHLSGVLQLFVYPFLN